MTRSESVEKNKERNYGTKTGGSGSKERRRKRKIENFYSNNFKDMQRSNIQLGSNEK